jgi:DNA polymerase III sliding clamp (beta) subunit (PCNA family)
MMIEVAEIAAKLGKIKGARKTKSPIPALEGILFRNNRLTAYNLEYGITAELDVETDETFILPERAVEMIEALPDGVVDITADDNNMISIQIGSIKNRFSSEPACDFPEIPHIDGAGGRFELPWEELEKAISSVCYVVPVKSQRRALLGVLFDAGAEWLNIVACDGYRMAWSRQRMGAEFEFIIPRDCIQKLLSIGLKESIEITFNKNHAIFKTPEYTVFTRLIEEKFLKYETALPPPINTTVINRDIFMECTRRALICQDKTQKPYATLRFGGREMEIAMKSGVSDYSETIRLEKELPNAIELGVNAAYLFDALRNFPAETMTVGLSSPTQPITLTDGDFKAMVLPVRISKAVQE